MSANESKEARILRQIVRGQRPWDDLESIGVHVHKRGDTYEILNSRGLTTIIRADDLAQGLLAYAHDPVKLREWAALIMADAIPCDLQMKDGTKEEDLLAVVKDIAFGGGLSEKSLLLARRLAR